MLKLSCYFFIFNAFYPLIFRKTNNLRSLFAIKLHFRIPVTNQGYRQKLRNKVKERQIIYRGIIFFVFLPDSNVFETT